MSPEVVNIVIRKYLTADEFVSSQLIRSLFSRWSKLLRIGKLTALTNEEDNNNELENEEAKKYQEKLHKLATKLSVIWLKDDWVAVVHKNQWYPGAVAEITEVGALIYCMKSVSFSKKMLSMA
ncbi:uncharacterized protein LOC136077130 [Hydra vulgaris]|uniref:Uncharacterized protein LOC136077130 n=1 Tax=Hydra vulgaris TaxID=6087 RepID=A0ABM4BFX7_HYDVU